MKCPFCSHQENKVVDSRISHAGDITRRRRECLSCNSRFTTYERVEELMPLVIKKDNRREEFSREKILEGVRIACRKRRFTALDFEDMVREVELKIQALGVRELGSREIGEFVMATLHARDTVAYIRFASVYREFKDVEDFLTELQKERLAAGPASPNAVN
jgi:transcriptional repressor NrdR